MRREAAAMQRITQANVCQIHESWFWPDQPGVPAAAFVMGRARVRPQLAGSYRRVTGNSSLRSHLIRGGGFRD
jgi:hypothetical protein